MYCKGRKWLKPVTYEMLTPLIYTMRMKSIFKCPPIKLTAWTSHASLDSASVWCHIESSVCLQYMIHKSPGGLIQCKLLPTSHPNGHAKLDKAKTRWGEGGRARRRRQRRLAVVSAPCPRGKRRVALRSLRGTPPPPPHTHSFPSTTPQPAGSCLLCFLKDGSRARL